MMMITDALRYDALRCAGLLPPLIRMHTLLLRYAPLCVLTLLLRRHFAMLHTCA